MTTFIIAGRAVLNHMEQEDGSIKYEPGGSAYLQAQLIKQELLDARVLLLTDLGNDAEGDKFARLIAKDNIETPQRIDRSKIELRTLYAYWQFDADSYDPNNCYLASVPVEHSALPNYQLPDDIKGPVVFIPTSEGTATEWADRYAHIADQAEALNALFVLLPNSRPDNPKKPDISRLKRENLPDMIRRAHLMQQAGHDFEHGLFQLPYGAEALEAIRELNPNLWQVVTNKGRSTDIFKPRGLLSSIDETYVCPAPDQPDTAVQPLPVPGLQAKHISTNAGTMFGARMLVEMDRRGLNTPQALHQDPSEIIIKLAECAAWGNWQAGLRLAENNKLPLASVKQPRFTQDYPG